MTAASTLKGRAERGFRRSNPDADLSIAWQGRVRKVQFPTGLWQYVARGVLSAPGYEPTSVTVYCDLDGSNFHTTTWSASRTRDLVRPMMVSR